MDQRHDITLNGLPLMLVRGAKGPNRALSVSEITDRVDEEFVTRDLPRVIDTLHHGGCYSQRLFPGTYAYAQNASCRHPRFIGPGPRVNAVTLTGATDHVRWAVETGGDLFFGGGRYAYKAAGGSAAATLASVNDFGSGISGQSAAPFLANGYVGTAVALTGVPDKLWRVASNGTWSGTHPTDPVLRKHLATGFYNVTNGYRLFGTDSLNTFLTAAADPMDSVNWGTAGEVGEAGSGLSINRVANDRDHFYFGTTYGPFDFDGSNGNTFNLLSQFASFRDPQNGAATHAHNGWLYFGHRRGLFRIRTYGQDAGLVENVTPGFGAPNETPVRGLVTAMCSDGAWIVCAQFNGTDTYISYGRERAEDDQGAGTMVWHPGEIYLPGEQCHLLHVSGLAAEPRLWIGAGAGSTFGIKWCKLSVAENPLQDAGYEFADSYSLFLPQDDFGLPTVRKSLLQIDIENDDLGVGASLAVKASVDAGAYNLIGTAATSPQSKLTPGTSVLGRRHALQLMGTGGGKLRAVTLRASARYRARQVRNYQVVLGLWVEDRFQGVQRQDPARIIDTLRVLAESGPIDLVDEMGVSMSVLVHSPIEYQEIESGGAGESTNQRLLTVPLRLSVLRTRSSGSAGAAWNDGTVWGESGKVWA